MINIIIAIFLIVSCASEKVSDEDVIRDGYQKKGREAEAVYASYSDDSPRVMYNLAYSLIEENDINKALGIALYAEEKYPGYIRFYSLEAYCYKKLDNTDKYISALKKIIAIDKGNIEVREILLDAYVDLELEEETIKEAREILFIDAKNTAALNALSLYIPFFQELTGYQPNERLIRKSITMLQEIEWLRISPSLKELGTLLPNKGVT